MQLSAYMERDCLSDADIAGLIDRDRSHVSRLRRGDAKPSWSTMYRLAKATRGAVMPNDFLDLVTSIDSKTDAQEAQ